MKRLTLAAVFLLVCGTASAQNESSNGGTALNGGYGSLDLKFTTFDGEEAGAFGVRGAWIGNHTFALGAGGYVFATDDLSSNSSVRIRGDQRIEGAYGGFLAEYYYKPQSVVHLAASVIVGPGYISRATGSHSDDTHVVLDESGFFMAEPSVGVKVNVAELIRLGLEGSYRFVVASNLDGYSDSDFSAFAVGLTFQIGLF